MSDKPYYPTVSQDVILTLKGITAQISKFPDYFKHPDCPYEPEIIAILARLAPKTAVEVDEEADFDFSSESIQAETARLYAEVRAFEKTLNVGDASERLQLFKLRSQLQDKLIQMLERVTNVKRLSDFQNVVLSILDDTLTPDQRTNVMARLRPFAQDETEE